MISSTGIILSRGSFAPIAPQPITLETNPSQEGNFVLILSSLKTNNEDALTQPYILLYNMKKLICIVYFF